MHPYDMSPLATSAARVDAALADLREAHAHIVDPATPHPGFMHLDRALEALDQHTRVLAQCPVR